MREPLPGASVQPVSTLEARDKTIAPTGDVNCRLMRPNLSFADRSGNAERAELLLGSPAVQLVTITVTGSYSLVVGFSDPAYAGLYGDDFNQKHDGVGSIVHLPMIHPGALVFFADPHAVISDGIISGTGGERSSTVRARINLDRQRTVKRPIIEQDEWIQIAPAPL